MNEPQSGNGTQGRRQPRDQSADDLRIIREQTRDTLELLRSLVSLMLPRKGGDGRSLEDLIAALIAQQRDILIGVGRIQADLSALFDRIDGEHQPHGNGRGNPNRSARP